MTGLQQPADWVWAFALVTALVVCRIQPFGKSIRERQKIVKPDIFGKNRENYTFALISIGFLHFPWVCQIYNPERTQARELAGDTEALASATDTAGRIRSKGRATRAPTHSPQSPEPRT
jgi:hypothetical protein